MHLYKRTLVPTESNVMTTYNAGDIVRLKSGGPKMTVLGVDAASGDHVFACKWFDRNGKLHSDSFPEDMIETFSPRPKDKPFRG